MHVYCLKPVFHYANLFARREAKTRIRQRDWLTKQQTFLPTNHVAEFLFSLRVARTNSPSGKRALGNSNVATFVELCGNTTLGQGSTSGEYVSPEHTISSFPNLYDC